VKSESIIGMDYKSQVVAGMNYDIRFRTETNKRYSVKVYEPLPFMESSPNIVGITELSD